MNKKKMKYSCKDCQHYTAKGYCELAKEYRLGGAQVCLNGFELKIK